MKLKATIEEAKTRANNNVRKLSKMERLDTKQQEEAAYWEGVRDALDWVIGKREGGLEDFWLMYYNNITL